MLAAARAARGGVCARRPRAFFATLRCSACCLSSLRQELYLQLEALFGMLSAAAIGSQAYARSRSVFAADHTLVEPALLAARPLLLRLRCCHLVRHLVLLLLLLLML